jgi:hypothetical protein
MRDMRRAFVADFDASADALASRNPAMKERFAAYLKDKQEFGILKDESETLATMLRDNTKSADAVIDYLLSPSAGTNRIRAVEKMLAATGDEMLVRDMKGALGKRIFEDGIVDFSADNPLIRYDFNKILKRLEGLGGEGKNTLTQITGDARYSDNLKGLAELGKRVQAVTQPMSETEKAGVLGRMAYLAKKASFKPEFFQEVIKSVSRSNKLDEYLTTLNIQKMTNRFPKSERPQLTNFLREALKSKEDAANKILKK